MPARVRTERPIGKDGTRQTTCVKATSKSGKPGERVYAPPLPGVCRMFYDEEGEPT